MDPFLRAVLSFIVPFFAVISMMSAGLGRSFQDVIAPLRRPASLIAALVANFALVPLLGYAIARALQLPQGYAIGLFLLSAGGGAALFVALVRIAGLGLSSGTGLLVLLLVVSAVYMPFVVPRVLPWATVEFMDIAWPLLLTMLLPLGLGLAVHAGLPQLTDKLQPLLRRAAQASLLILIAATFLLYLPSIVAMLGSGALVAAFLLTLGAVAIGYALGGSDPKQRALLALGTGQRNVAAAMVVATTAFDQPEPLVMVVVSSLVAFIVLFPAALLFRRLRERRTIDRLRPSPHEPVGSAGRRAPT